MWITKSSQQRQIFDEPPIVQEIFKGNEEQVAALLEENDPDAANYQDHERRSLLHAAAFCGNPRITKLLIDRGARVNSKDNKWITPLHRACCHEEDYDDDDDDDFTFMPTTGATVQVAPPNNQLPLASNSTTSGLVLTNSSNAVEDGSFSGTSGLVLSSESAAADDTNNDVGSVPKTFLSDVEETVAILLEANADVTARDKMWQTPIHVAAANNALSCARLLLTKVTNVNISDRAGHTALHHAAFNGHYYMVELLLKHKAHVNLLDKCDRRPIHWAAFNGYSEIVQLLVRAGADVDVHDKELYTPLHAAAANGRLSVVQLLLSLGARPDAVNAHGNTPLHIACLNGHADVAAEMLAAGVARDAINRCGLTPLHYAAMSTNSGGCLELLIKEGAAVNARSNDGRTALHMSAIHGRMSRAESLITAGAVVEVADRRRLSPLHIATRYGHELLVSKLLQCGANADAVDVDGIAPVHLAALHNHLECFKKLVTVGVGGANVAARDHQGRTVMHYATFGGSVDIVDYLLSRYCQTGLAQQMHSSVDSLGRFPLHYCCAASRSCNDIVNNAYSLLGFLLDVACNGAGLKDGVEGKGSGGGDEEKGCDLEMEGGGDGCVAVTSSSALRFGGGRQQHNILNARDVDGCTPLHFAASNDAEGRSVEMLLCRGVDPFIEDNDGFQALHYAAAAGHEESVRELLHRYKNYDMRSCFSRNGISPLHLAAAGGHELCLDLLLNACQNSLATMYMMLVAQDHHHGWQLLSLACHGGHIRCVQRILSAATTLNLTSMPPSPMTPPNLADNVTSCSNGHFNFNDIDGVAPIEDSLVLEEQPKQNGISENNCSDVSNDQLCSPNGLDLGIKKQLLRKICLPLLPSQLAGGRTALHVAAARGETECVRLFLAECAFGGQHRQCSSPLASLENGTNHIIASPISHSSTNNPHSAGTPVKKKNGIRTQIPSPVDLADSQGRTALMVTALNGRSDCVALLLAAGAWPNAMDKQGRSPLFYAILGGDAACVEELLRHDANSLHCDSVSRKTPLHLAAAAVNINNRARGYQHKPQSNAAVTAAGAILNLLLKLGATLTRRPDAFYFDRDGFTPVHWAAYKGCPTTLELLLKFCEGSVTASSNGYITPPKANGCLTGNGFTSENELSQLFNKWTSTSNGINPLHCAAYSGSELCLELLIKHYGESIATFTDNTQSTALHYASSGGSVECVNSLIEWCDVNAKDNRGRTPLMIAAANGSTQVVELLLKRGAIVTIVDNNANTALHHAVLKRQEAAVESLLDNCDHVKLINMSNKKLDTALHISAREGLIEATQALIVRGADVLARNSLGLCPALACAPTPRVAQCLSLILGVMPSVAWPIQQLDGFLTQHVFDAGVISGLYSMNDLAAAAAAGPTPPTPSSSSPSSDPAQTIVQSDCEFY